MEDVKRIYCTLCLEVIDDNNLYFIKEDIREVLKVFLIKLNLAKDEEHVVCNVCFNDLSAAVDFKLKCMETENRITPYTSLDNGTLIDLNKVYLKINGNEQSINLFKSQKICRLCLQAATDGFVPLQEVIDDTIDIYFSRMEFSATKDPVICMTCWESCNVHIGFIENCIDIAETNNYHLPPPFYVKTDNVAIKLKKSEQEHDMDVGEVTEYVFDSKVTNSTKNTPSFKIEAEIKSENIGNVSEHNERDGETFKPEYVDVERIEIKQEGDTSFKRDNFVHRNRPGTQTPLPKTNREESSKVKKYKCVDCDFETVYKFCITRHQVKHKPVSEVQMYKCVACDYQTIHKGVFKQHGLKHRDPAEVKNDWNAQMYKCDKCNYENHRRRNLARHQLSHKNNVEAQTYVCNECGFETIRKEYLRKHQMIHKDRAEVRIYKCRECCYETFRKFTLIKHQLTHMKRSEAQMYKCDRCDYETVRKEYLRKHQLKHKDRVEIRTHKCDNCDFETIRKESLTKHQLVHKNRSEVQTYKCSDCDFQSVHRGSFRKHLIIHKKTLEAQMYKCDVCNFLTIHKGSLARHQLRHLNPSNVETYKCNGCNFESVHKGSLARHQLREIHFA